MADCIFCSIVNGKTGAAVIWEDKEFLAILDVNPAVRGMTLVLPKKHYPSYAFDLPDVVYASLFRAARNVALLLDKKLGVRRTAMAMEGLGVNHVHIKLYPMHGLREKFTETWAPERVFFRKYPGYLSTQLGPKADLRALKKLAQKIQS